MRNNETGEFELVVGNRQLLSGFFIVVLLFAVAFAMGYVVGENSRSAKTAPPAAPGAPQPAPADVRPQPAAAPPALPETAPPSKAPDAETAPADAASQPTTQPARDTVSSPAATAPAGAPPAAAGVPSAPGAAASAPAAGASGLALQEPAAGSYWQVMAIANRESAQTLVQTLKDKGFPAMISPGPNNLTRVLVGPYSDTASMGRAKTELENAGFIHLGSFKK